MRKPTNLLSVIAVLAVAMELSLIIFVNKPIQQQILQALILPSTITLVQNDPPRNLNSSVSFSSKQNKRNKQKETLRGGDNGRNNTRTTALPISDPLSKDTATTNNNYSSSQAAAQQIGAGLRDESSGRYKTPSFLIIGAQKSGTTALHEFLREHPMIYSDKRKEKHFFNDRKFFHVSDKEAREEYLGRFATAAPTTTTGGDDDDISDLMRYDATPMYLLLGPHIIPRILQVCPWVKIIVILRDPVERAYSNYAMQKKGLGLKVPFDVKVHADINRMIRMGLLVGDPKNFSRCCPPGSEAEEAGAWEAYTRTSTEYDWIVGRGIYSIQLRFWFQAFSQQNILVLNSHRMKGPTGAQYTVDKVYSFLGLPQHRLNQEIFADADTGFKRDYSKVPPISNETRKFLYDFYEPYNRELETMLGEQFREVWERKK